MGDGCVGLRFGSLFLDMVGVCEGMLGVGWMAMGQWWVLGQGLCVVGSSMSITYNSTCTRATARCHAT